MSSGVRPAVSSGGKQEEGGACREERKTSWPEVVGMSAEEAKKVILKDMPGADIVVLPAESAVTLDYHFNRVRIVVDTVAEIPRIG